MSGDIIFQAFGDEPRLLTRLINLAGAGGRENDNHSTKASSGAGVGKNVNDCLVPAVVEALERQAAAYIDERILVVSSQEDLGEEALNLSNIHRCSDLEVSDPKCPLLQPNNHLPLRWVQGIRLHDGKPMYIPLVLTHLCKHFSFEGERFFLPISTGCAGHTSYDNALLGGLLEVIERDALSLTWLHKVSLPRIPMLLLEKEFPEAVGLYEASSCGLTLSFFDASLDHGVPVVYGIQTSTYDSRLATLVSCSASTSFPAAMRKVMYDMAACRISLRRPRRVPEDIRDFKDISDGATYMSSSARREAFDFLDALSLPAQAPSNWHRSAKTMAPSDILRQLVRSLAAAGHHAYTVDLTTVESDYVGIKVVKVIVPTLQPLGFNYRARYLGSPRLYSVTLPAGQRPLSEERLNPNPQPFA